MPTQISEEAKKAKAAIRVLGICSKEAAEEIQKAIDAHERDLVEAAQKAVRMLSHLHIQPQPDCAMCSALSAATAALKRRGIS